MGPRAEIHKSLADFGPAMENFGYWQLLNNSEIGITEHRLQLTYSRNIDGKIKLVSPLFKTCTYFRRNFEA